MIHCLLIIGKNRYESGLRMIESADNEQVKIYVIWRGFAKLPAMSGLRRPYFETVLTNCSVSQGRNILLGVLLKDDLVSNQDVVCFADDDGLWPSDLIPNLKTVFDNNISWALGIYGPLNSIDKKRFPPQPCKSLSLGKLIKRSSSLGIYSTIGLVRKIGLFDENLGLGSAISIGEDTDYILRLHFESNTIFYCPTLVQIHSYENVRLNSRELHAMDFYLHLRKKGYPVGFLFLRRSLSLLVKGKINPSQLFVYIKKWVVRDSNPRPGD
jgi:hypothetical protein